jgi:glycosyltransferase involved in cell wall biosynthesis
MSTRIKILFVRPTLGHGGADRVTLNILEGYDRSKYDCHLALVSKKGEFIGDIPEDVTVINTKAKNAFLMFLPLRKIIKDSDYDVIYSTSGGTNVPVLIAAALCRKKILKVISERSIMLPAGKNKIKQRFFHSFKKLMYPSADIVTVVSKALAEEVLKETRVDRSKIRVVYNPMVNDRMLSLSKEELTHPVFRTGANVILAVGRFEIMKDYDTLFQAVKKVNEVKPVHLFLLGKGGLEGKYRKLARQMGLENNIHFGGFDKNPFKYMRSCSAFVLSSRNEGMPGVLIQALACGAPCISTDCPTGPNEIITDNVNGFLVSVGDYMSIADRILKIIDDRSVAARFSENGPKSVSQFHYKPALESYLNFLN